MNSFDDKAYYLQKTVSKRRLHGEVAYRLGLQIVSGRFVSGDALPNENDLGQGFSVSRTAYREAIKILGAKGLVESKPRSGTRVAKRKNWNLLDPDVLAWHFEAGTDSQFVIDLYELRRIIEPAAASLAAQRRTSVEIKAIAAALRQMENADAEGIDRLTADLGFHRAILEASRNQVLLSTWSAIESTLRWSVRLKNETAPHTFTEALKSHAEVYKEIAAGNPDRASEAMNALIRSAQEDTLKQLGTVS